jgi:hypothetical protein
MKKPTQLDVLIEIRGLLQELVGKNPVVDEELWTVVEQPDLKTSDILNFCREKFNVWVYYSDEKLDDNFPPPEETTKRKFKARIEADEEHKNKSTEDLEREGVEVITLRERLLLELDYFNRTKKHLDVKNITLCAGSRYSDGDVPSVGWNPDDRKLYVDWRLPDYARSSLRARAAVSF